MFAGRNGNAATLAIRNLLAQFGTDLSASRA